MKTLYTVILSTFILWSNSQDLYSTADLTNIQITFTQTNWDQILDTYYANGNDERLMATISINGIVYDSVAIKYKGNSTYNANNDKNPFNIKLDEFKSHDYDGFTVLKLSTGDKDPSFVREVLGYEIARKYMDAPRANFAEIYINGSFHGLYDNVESVNGDFQEKHLFANRDHARLKCNPVDVFNGGSSLEYLGATESSYYDYYELDTDSGWLDLINLCNVINNAPNLIEDYLDVDRAIWMLAYNNVLVNLDSYTGPFKQNYYLIKAKNDNLLPIIWDLNQSFGSFSMINQGPPGGVLAEMELLLRQNDTDWPLLNLILQDDTYRRMYIAHCKTIYEENIATGEYYTRCQELQATFSGALQADNNAIYTYAQAQTNLTATVTGGGGPGGGFIGIKELFDDRSTYLAGTSEFQALAPSITNINHPESVYYGNTVDITADITNANDATLSYREFQGDRFTKITMVDDGTNGDVVSGDGTYTATIQTNASDIQFYIYAENNDAGMFSPQRAEHEFYAIGVINDVVINEMQARNDVTSADQNGEFDDWVELYNNSDVSVDLSNYFLSDKGSELGKWAFPAGTSIAPDEYLIVWCDGDTLQGGIHANFKLSGGGESVYLTDGVNIFDKVKYVYFERDTSYARFPNGTGPVVYRTPTFKANNGGGTVGIQDDIEAGYLFKMYPNPSNTIVHIEKGGDLQVNVYDVLGNLIVSTKENTLQVKDWTAGIYFVQINNVTRKLVVK